MDELESKIRRSSRLHENSIFREFISYASMVRDEDEVYVYMEENKIGIHEPQFWAAKLKFLKNTCRYQQFIRVLETISKVQAIKKHSKYWLITSIKEELEKYLEKMLRKRVKSRRSAREYELLTFATVEKQIRKFGKTDIFVDPDCRMQYRLEDLVEFVQGRLKEELDLQRNCYDRQNRSRPLSFLGRKNEQIDKMSQELINQVNSSRKENRRSLKVGRPSNRLHSSIGCIMTPDFKKKGEKNFSPSRLDSIQILKKIGKKNNSTCNSAESQESQKSHSSHSQNDKINPETPTQKAKERARLPRSSYHSECSIKRGERDFSFGEKSASPFPSTESKIYLTRMNPEHLNVSQNDSNHNKYDEKIDDSISKKINNAFLEQTQTQGAANNTKVTIQLESIIHEVQMQKYESQTFSEIDSNKENFCIQNHFCQDQNEARVKNNGAEVKRDRRIFETVKKLQSSDGQSSSSSPSKFLDHQEDSGSSVYKQLLNYLDSQQSLADEFELKKSCCASEREPKRISRISEQKSYSHSETRSKNV